jgi:transglutaminase-like putative cysteine protease
MRFSVLHRSIYRYDRPVVLEPHIIRLRPREDGSQRLISYQLDISPPPQGRAECLDQDGNATTQVWFSETIAELAVHSAFQVETLRANPFDFLLPAPEILALPPTYSPTERDVLGPYRSLPVDPSSEPVHELAASIAVRAGGQTMPFVEMLTQELFSTCEHETRPDGAPNPPAETLSLRRGSCRDLSVLFCAACRAVGIASRFVSGYETESSFSDEHASMHAWPEVYIPGGGWRGYDPSRGVAVSDQHVAVAAAADPALAAPIAGSYRGAASAQVEFTISMQVNG